MGKKIIETNHVNLFYGDKQALFDINVDFEENKVTAIIGPSGCGKSTFLRTLNRMHDESKVQIKGDIQLYGEDILGKKMKVTELRKKVGMIFQSPNPFPMSIYDNVVYGPRIYGTKNKAELDGIVERTLKLSGLWEEVKDRLSDPATSLSGGQAQRLCIARAIANEPEVLLMDEPTSALDPVSTLAVEKLIRKLGKTYTIILVTHSLRQATIVSDYTAHFDKGRVVEFSKTKQLFTNPSNKITEKYIRGNI